MKVVWTEQAWARLIAIEAFIARDHPEAAVRLIDKLIARGAALGRAVSCGHRTNAGKRF